MAATVAFLGLALPAAAAVAAALLRLASEAVQWPVGCGSQQLLTQAEACREWLAG
jgi:hypothetical protein